MDDEAYQDEAGAFAPGAAAVVASMERKLLDNIGAFIMHAGDLSYACGVEMKWDYWMHTIAPVSSKVPYMVAVGNHEYDYLTGSERDPSGAAEPYIPPAHSAVYDDDSLGECGVPSARRFQMPRNGNKVPTDTPMMPPNQINDRLTCARDFEHAQVFWYSFEVGLAHFVVISLEHNVTSTSPQGQWLQADLIRVDRVSPPESQ